ncbi:MAG: TetR/AcrR family transcriptional regulator [Sporichthyaceae bacterium]
MRTRHPRSGNIGEVARPGEVSNKRNTPRINARKSGEKLIFEATERLLREVPVRDLSVEQILEESGVSRRTFYVYFASKYGVIMRLAEAVVRDISETLEPLLARPAGEHGPDALRRAVDAGCAVWAGHADVLRAVVEHWQEVDDLREAWLGALGQVAAAMSAEIDRERAAGAAQPGPDSLALAWSLIWASANVLHFGLLGQVSGLPKSPRQLVDPICAMWMGAIYGAPVSSA